MKQVITHTMRFSTRLIFFQQIVRNSDESPQNAINEATYITLITYFYNIQIYFETYL